MSTSIGRYLALRVELEKMSPVMFKFIVRLVDIGKRKMLT